MEPTKVRTSSQLKLNQKTMTKWMSMEESQVARMLGSE